MTTPARYDLEIYQGDDFKLPLQITVNGVPKDSTGSTFAAQIKTPSGQAVASFEVVLTDLPTTQIELVLPTAITSALSPTQRYIWDWQETNGSNQITTWMHGNVTVVGQVTT